MNKILWSITIIAQLVCLWKQINFEELKDIEFYRKICIAFGICGICIANIPEIQNSINLEEIETWLLIN